MAARPGPTALSMQSRSAAQLKEIYRTWRSGTPCWDDQLEKELVAALPVYHVLVSRLKIEPWSLGKGGWQPSSGLPSTIYPEKVTQYAEDVKAGRTDEWRPLIVEGLPPPETGPVLVVEGHHRTTAALEHGAPGLCLPCVFARERQIGER